MKTIEERAKEYAETRCINVESNIHKRFLMDAFSSSYIQGAKEQKEIDDANIHERFEKVLNGQKWDLIDEACKWLSDYFVFKHEAMSAQGCDAFLHVFRKAMGDRYEE